MIHLLLFDVDGTLILTGGAGIRAFQRAFHELFRREVETDGIRFHGRTDPEIVEDIFAAGLSRSPTPEELQAICSRYIAHLEEEVRHSPGFRIMPGLPHLLEMLAVRAEVRLGLATGNLEGAARIKLDRADLNRYFPFGGFGSDAKDRTVLIQKAIERGRDLADRPHQEIRTVPDPRGAPSDLQPVSRPPRRGGASLARLPHHAGTPPPIGDACRSG